MKDSIFGKDLKECETLMVDRKEPKYRGGQLFQWLYEKKCENFNDMTNFSNNLREKLSEDFELNHGTKVRINLILSPVNFN